MKRRWLPVAAGFVALAVAGILIGLRLDPGRGVRGPAAQEHEPAALNPAPVPAWEAGPPDGAFPGGPGDRAVIDHDRNRVVRMGPVGAIEWATPLAGYLGRVRPPHVAADNHRAYVTHATGVTALDAGTGRVVWQSPGPQDRLLLSGDLLLAADCTGGEAVGAAGRWLVARRAGTGGEGFRVALPVRDFDPDPIWEAAGLFVVQTHESPAGTGAALLIDRTGRVVHRFDRQVVAVAPAGSDRLVLTSRDVVRLRADGGIRWVVAFEHREWSAGGGLLALPGGDVVAYLYCRTADTGVWVVRLDPAAGRKGWQAVCDGVGVTHSEYRHEAVADADGGRVTVTSRGSYGTFVEALDADTGLSVGRRVITK